MVKNQNLRHLVFNFLVPSLVLLIFVGVWHYIAVSGLFLPDLLPSPEAVWAATLELAQNGALFNHILSSLGRVFVGFGLAVIAAVPAGFVLGRYRRLQQAFNPLIQILRPISPIAWIPLAILWFGIGNKPAIFIIFITTFFPVMIASITSVRNIDPILIKTAINYGAKDLDILWKIILPATFPHVFVSLRIALGMAWVIIVAAEMVGMRSGLGYMILDARNFLRTDMLVSGMITIGLVGFGLDRIMVYIENRTRKRWGYKYVYIFGF
jgi:NitT/TauT family transport system permease protein